MKRFFISILATLFLVGLISQGYASEPEPQTKYYGGHLCAYEGFKCIKVKSGDTWEKLFPNEKQREMVMRLNRINMPLYYRQWIVVPTNFSKLDYMDLSPFPDHVDTNSQKMVVISLSLQAFAAYDQEGYLVHWGPISGGKGWCPDINRACKTTTGDFKVIEKKGAKCFSKRFPVETAGGAPMPYCMFFFEGFALHASTLPGFNASHGCVRMFKEDAKWLNEDFVNVGTRVIVTQ